MAEDNQDQAREMAEEGLKKAKSGAGNAGEGRELTRRPSGSTTTPSPV